MFRISATIVAALITVQPVFATSQCVTEMRDFDYMATSPQEFMRGTIEEVRTGYRAMLDMIGDVPSVRRATQYFVDPESFTRVTARECDEELCTGHDFVQGLIECSRGVNHVCSPLAAIKDGTLYCVLKPEFEYAQPQFQPFG